METCRLQQRIMFVFLAIACLVSTALSFPTEASAEETLPVRMQAGAVVPSENDTTTGTLMWAGKEWYVVGSASDGLAPTSTWGAYTLLAKESFGDSVYRFGQATYAAGLKPDIYSRWYYSGTWKNAPSDYMDSTVQQYLQSWLQSSGATPLEQSLVVARELADVGATGSNAQPLWLLSANEELGVLDPLYVALGRDSTAAAIDESWWTRTASTDVTNGKTKAVLVDPYGSTDSADYIHNSRAVRPASTIDLSDVAYTSVAEARRGKTLAEVGDSLMEVTTLPASGRLPVYKYTVTDASLSFSAAQKAGQPTTLSESIAFSYQDATPGDSQYVSCVLLSKPSGSVAYYGKLAAIDASGSGEATLSAEGLADGAYELRLYNEQSTGQLVQLQVNGTRSDYEGYTDFVSAPVTLSLYVHDGKATTSSTGTITYKLNGGALPEGVSNPTSHKLGDAPQNLASPELVDKVFDGWYRTVDFTGEAVTVVDDALLGDVTLYAKWIDLPEAGDITLTYATADEQQGTVTPESELVKPEAGAAKGSVATAEQGYHLEKWTNDLNEDETTDATLTREQIDAVAKATGTYVPVAFTAHFARDTYHIAYDSNGGTGEMQPQDMTVGENAPLEPNVFERVGFTFLGWSEDATATETTYADQDTVTNLASENGTTVTLYAVWKAKTHTVEFITDDDDDAAVEALDGSTSTSEEVEHGHKVERPADPKRAGYDFRYWAAPDGQAFDFDTPVTEDIVLRAVWQARDYVVNYDAAGGLLFGGASRTIQWKTAGILPVSEPTYGRYLFDGWYFDTTKVDANATYASVAADDTVSSITLTAHWREAPRPTYPVTFDSCGGSAVEPQTVTEGASAARPADPTREGYVFDDWYVTGTESVFSFDTALYDAVSLEAHWIEAGKYALTYVATGDVPADWEPVTYGLLRAGDVVLVDDPTVTGYEFDGWYVGSDRSVKYSQNAFFTMPASDVTLTGTWKKASARTVTFDSRGGSAVRAQQVEDGAFATSPTAPTREGFTFKEWQLDGTTYSFDEPVTTDLLLTATWERDDTQWVTVSFDLAGGKGTQPTAQKCAVGSQVSYPSTPAPERDGYQFFGWVTSDGAAYSFDTAVKTDLTLYAGWTALAYQVRYVTGSSAIAPATVTWDTAALNAPLPAARDGFVFTGWKCNGSFVTSEQTYSQLALDEEGVANPSVTSIVLTAQWEAKTQCSVSYDAAGGIAIAGRTDLTPDSHACTGEKSGFADVETTREGYRFTGWSCSTKQGDNKSVGSSDTYADLAPDGRANITLVAQWKKTATLTFNATDIDRGQMDPSLGQVRVTVTAQDSPEPITTETGTSVTLTFDADTTNVITAQSCLTEAAIEANYFGALWSGPDGNFVSNVEQVGETRDWRFVVQPQFDGTYATGTYKTNFFSIDPFASVEYVADGAHPDSWVVPEESLPWYSADESFTLPLVPSIEGWTFKGWRMQVKTTSVFSTAADAEERLYAPGETYTVPAEYAQNWNVLSFAGVWEKTADALVNVSYDATGDVPEGWSAPQAASVAPSSSITLPVVDIPQGYSFDGWYLGDVRYEAGTDVVLPPSGSATFKGTWKKDATPVDPAGPDDPGKPSGPDAPSTPAAPGDTGSNGAATTLARTGDVTGAALFLIVSLTLSALVVARTASKRKG